MALPYGTTGSLCSTFVPGRLVSLTVKHPYAIALYARLPSVLRVPLEASVTLLEATTPVKLPTTHCLLIFNIRIRHQINKGRYFKVDSTYAGAHASLPPGYPTHHLSNINVKL